MFFNFQKPAKQFIINQIYQQNLIRLINKDLDFQKCGCLTPNKDSRLLDLRIVRK